MINREEYDAPKLLIVAMQEKDIIRTSEIFVANDAPDVFEKDPFTELFGN